MNTASTSGLITRLPFVYDDGGRASAGFRGETGDCVVRAITIVSRLPYREVYETIRDRSPVSPRRGVPRKTYDPYLVELGFVWTPVMKLGSGCVMHLNEDELPAGDLIVRLSRHFTAVINGAIHDTFDPSREGTRCVYGYWRRR